MVGIKCFEKCWNSFIRAGFVRHLKGWKIEEERHGKLSKRRSMAYDLQEEMFAAGIQMFLISTSGISSAVLNLVICCL